MELLDSAVFEDADQLNEFLEKLRGLVGMEVRDSKGNLLTTMDVVEDDDRKWIVLR